MIGPVRKSIAPLTRLEILFLLTFLTSRPFIFFFSFLTAVRLSLTVHLTSYSQWVCVKLVTNTHYNTYHGTSLCVLLEKEGWREMSHIITLLSISLLLCFYLRPLWGLAERWAIFSRSTQLNKMIPHQQTAWGATLKRQGQPVNLCVCVWSYVCVYISWYVPVFSVWAPYIYDFVWKAVFFPLVICLMALSWYV